MSIKNKKLFQVEWDQKGEKVEIHFDNNGLSYFISLLEKLRNKDAPNDIHLMTLEWGGGELSSSEDSGDRRIVNHLKLLKW
jgi:hypothetical protein